MFLCCYIILLFLFCLRNGSLSRESFIQTFELVFAILYNDLVLNFKSFWLYRYCFPFFLKLHVFLYRDFILNVRLFWISSCCFLPRFSFLFHLCELVTFWGNLAGFDLSSYLLLLFTKPIFYDPSPTSNPYASIAHSMTCSSWQVEPNFLFDLRLGYATYQADLQF